jgi:hypothetical protein
MAITFQNVTVSNSTADTLSVSPWNCDCELLPGGSTFGISCVSDGVIDQTTGLSYIWVNNAAIRMPSFATFVTVTPAVVTLAVFTRDQDEKGEIRYQARVSNEPLAPRPPKE